MEAIGTLFRWLSGCKGTDNNRPDQIKFDFFCKTVLCMEVFTVPGMNNFCQLLINILRGEREIPPKSRVRTLVLRGIDVWRITKRLWLHEY